MVKQLNRTIKNGIVTRLTSNPEGGIVYKENDDLSLFLLMSSFKLQDAFYFTADETLKTLEDLLDNASADYKLALAMFLSELMGIKLSPVIAVTREAMTKPSFGAKSLIKSATKVVFDRPDKIANALAYAEFYFGTFKRLPPFYKRALRDVFEQFDAYTLRKFKLKRRKVKTSDIIKVLRPKPRNAMMSNLYKAIIENSVEAAIEKDTVITEVLSSTEKTQTEKREWISKNIRSIPFNALIRNLRNLVADGTNLDGLDAILAKNLRVSGGLPQVKVANPFDVLIAALNCGNDKTMKVMDTALYNYMKGVDLGLAGKKVSVLVDISGSMGPGWENIKPEEAGIVTAANYMSLLMAPLYDADVRLYAFDSKVQDKTPQVALYKRNVTSPVTIRQLFLNDFKPHGSTALADSVKFVVAKDSPDLLIVISDEISWADTRADAVFNTVSVDTKVLAINPSPQSRTTVFDPAKPVIKISSLDAKIFYYIPMLANFKRFKDYVISWAFRK